MSERWAPLLTLDPDLGQLLPAERREAAARLTCEPRRFDAPSGLERTAPSHLGLLVIDGVLARDVTVPGSVATELLGAGDVIRPTDTSETTTVGSDVSWCVIDPVRAAVLDRRLIALAAQWPPVLEALLSRAVSRAHAVTLRQASMRVPQLDRRILVVLWSLADRWGHVRPDGVSLPLPLTHDLLGRLVGAGRPAVTRALTRLRQGGLVRRTAGAWILDTSGQDGAHAGV